MEKYGLKKYLCFGGGVDSTTLMLWLEDNDEEFEIVFINHHADKPQTYQYVKYLQSKGRKITIIDAGSLIKYCRDNKVFPMRQWKWCTDKFKLRPMSKYFETPCICFIGIGAYEIKRLKKFTPIKKGVFNVAPLVSLNMTREDQKQFIKNHKLKIPEKSGCYICPNMKSKELKELKSFYPKLYDERMELEKECYISIHQKNNHQLFSFLKE